MQALDLLLLRLSQFLGLLMVCIYRLLVGKLGLADHLLPCGLNQAAVQLNVLLLRLVESKAGCPDLLNAVIERFVQDPLGADDAE